MGGHQSRLVLQGRFNKAAPRLSSSSSSSSSSAAAMIRRPWTQLAHDDDDSGSESPVYRRALKLQRPTTVKYYQHTSHNSVSLIGTIERPLKECNNAAARFGVHTVLKVVRPYPGACPSLRGSCYKYGVDKEKVAGRLVLQPAVVVAYAGPVWFNTLLWFADYCLRAGFDEVEHLKPPDLIYVSGHLGSYVKVEDGKPIRFYEVNVKEVNFVAQKGLGPACQNTIKLESKASVEEMKQNRRIRLHLWQVFFANPSEWWDNRNSKRKPSAPDFKHKDTGEALWLQETDPPWIRKQLQLHDSRLGKRGPGGYRNSSSYLSPLVYKDVFGT